MLDPEFMFTVFIADRQRVRGGGVCVLVNKNIKAVEVHLQDTPSDVDMLCIDLLFSQPYRMFVVYSPPSVSSELATITELVKCMEIIIIVLVQQSSLVILIAQTLTGQICYHQLRLLIWW